MLMHEVEIHTACLGFSGASGRNYLNVLGLSMELSSLDREGLFLELIDYNGVT